MTSITLLDVDIHSLRNKLINYVRKHVRDEASAEDLVQETLAAICTSPQQFRGDSQVSTYAIGILRHKIADLFRAQQRLVALYDSTDEELASDDAVDLLHLNHQAHDTSAYSLQAEPGREMERQQLRTALHFALTELPARYRQAFVMREMVGLETEDIAEQLGISVNNAWVMLHRARKKLQEQLSHIGIWTLAA